jgi:hypothetical protein
MTRRPSGLKGQMEKRIEAVIAPGRFISYNASFGFVTDLGAVERQIASLVSSEPALSVSLYETFIAACHEKAEEIDDSGGSLGQFVAELACGWVKARQAARGDASKTAARLVAWMDDDPYGFFFRVEQEVVKVFDKAGLAAFEKQIRTQFEGATVSLAPSEPSRRSVNAQRRRCGEVLRTVYLMQKNVDAYFALGEKTGLTAQDCHALATMLGSRRKLSEALAWADRGLAIDQENPHGSMASHDLARLRRDLLVKMGRGNEARDAAWAEYLAFPSRYSYGDLMKYVPKAERRAWHEKAIDAAKGANLQSQIELLLETKETGRLVALVRESSDAAVETVSHHVTEPAARKLERMYPESAARLWCAQGMRIVKGKKSKYYEAALSNFERARRCFERAGQLADWQRIVSVVRSEHHRQTGFMSGFEKVVAGSGPSERPTFLKRAKARWALGDQSAFRVLLVENRAGGNDDEDVRTRVRRWPHGGGAPGGGGRKHGGADPLGRARRRHPLSPRVPPACGRPTRLPRCP